MDWADRVCVPNGIEILFGVASFHGTNPSKIAPSLSLLHSKYLAPRILW